MMRNLRLYVPNFAPSPAAPSPAAPSPAAPSLVGPMDTYLRLGTVPDPDRAGSTEIPAGDPSGEDLAARVQSFDDDERRRCAADATVEPGAGAA